MIIKLRGLSLSLYVNRDSNPHFSLINKCLIPRGGSTNSLSGSSGQGFFEGGSRSSNTMGMFMLKSQQKGENSLGIKPPNTPARDPPSLMLIWERVFESQDRPPGRHVGPL